MEITIIIQRHLDIYILKPYIEEFRRRGVKIYFAVSNEIKNDCESIIDPDEEIINLDSLSRKHSICLRFHNLLRLVLTDQNFSSLYKNWVKKNFSRTLQVLAKFISFFLPSYPSNEVNEKLGNIFKYFISNPFPSERVLYATKMTTPHLLCGSDTKVYTILGSWDHPGKYPTGHPSTKVFVWNDFLKKDWQDFQDKNNIRLSYPVLHHYALSENSLKRNRNSQSDFKRIMYPATFCSWSKKEFFDEELNLIENLCLITKDSDYKLFIKPKPNSKKGEFDQFLSYPHVEIGHYLDNSDISRFILSEQYNQKRLSEMEKSDLVVNLATTFAVDAAAYGLSVVQLMIDKPEKYPYLSNLKESPHLSRHYYSKRDLIFILNGSSPIQKDLSFLNNPSEFLRTANMYTKYLRDWIMPREEMKQTVGKIVESCFK